MNLDEKNKLLLAKFQARQETNYAVKQGYLEKEPCSRCGYGRVEAHHNDYAKPLEIVWLCKGCHMELHYDVLSGRLGRELTDIQSSMLDYFLGDMEGVRAQSIDQIQERFELPTKEAVAMAVFALLMKGYLEPAENVKDTDEVEYLFYVAKKKGINCG